MVITKNVDRIAVSEEYYDSMENDVKIRQLKNAMKQFDALIEELEGLIEKNEWIKIENREVYYNKKYNLLMPDLDKFEAGSISIDLECDKSKFRKLNFDDFKGEILDSMQIKDIFFSNNKSIFYKRYEKVVFKKNNRYGYMDGEREKIIMKDENNPSINSSVDLSAAIIAAHATSRAPIMKGRKELVNTTISKKAYYIPAYVLEPNLSYLELFIKYDLLPLDMTECAKQLFEELIVLYDAGGVKIGKHILPTKSAEEKVISGKWNHLLGVSFRKADIHQTIKKELKNNKHVIRMKEEDKRIFLKKYLDCDKIRADIESYDMKRMEDPNLGHWELWSDANSSDIKVKIDPSFVARNPLSDVKDNCIVGIDFGTKSTIVVYQDGNENTQSMRIGAGRFSKEGKAADFENPTVMELINLDHFLTAYYAEEGRPHTLWNDVTISHTAYHSLTDVNAKSDEFYSFFYDLKQWAGDHSRQIKLKDKSGKERLLSSYLSIKEGEFDPIELYAYYIGLYINNMHNGIYLNYLLSFPVTYEKAAREKILQSFSRGIKKSLPNEVLKDADVMKRFHLRQGASEPAAYAICALQQYGFDPMEEEKVFYGIFDFGGGTTDFDFGIWKSAKEEEELYDYVISHFGANGDRYLGGENLLELLAYTVFCDNIELCRKERISFQKPADQMVAEDIKFFISDSQEAKMNMKQLMEQLRPFWERVDEKYAEPFAEGIRLHLFDRDGNPKMNLNLKVDTKKLDEVLYKRIEKGIRNFFEALKLTFCEERIADTGNVNEINIFLAGNSSKSPIVRELFNKCIAERTELIAKMTDSEQEFFKIYPPLGTEEAKRIQEVNQIKIEDSLTAPTGKTGVAFGLVEGRPGGRIKVISETASDAEVKFSYYLGIHKKKKFVVKISREAEYRKWYRFISAANEDVEIYYTNLPEATTNQLSIKEVSKKIVTLAHTDERAAVYIRLVKPSVIEYAVGIDENQIEEACAVRLELN